MRPMGASYFRIPIIGPIEFAKVLFHEIGHHIHAVHRPAYDGKENTADDWSKKLLPRFGRRRYWYALPVLYPLAKVLSLGLWILKRMFPKAVLQG